MHISQIERGRWVNHISFKSPCYVLQIIDYNIHLLIHLNESLGYKKKYPDFSTLLDKQFKFWIASPAFISDYSEFQVQI